MCIVSKQHNKFYNSKNQMNKELLLDYSAFTLFYSLKHAVFSSNCKNFSPNFINLMDIPIKKITNQTENLPYSCRSLILKKKLRPLILNVVSRFLPLSYEPVEVHSKFFPHKI